MTLTDPNALIGQLQSAEYWSQESPVDTNRAYRRFDVRGDATIQRMEAGHLDQPTLSIQLRDISRGGIGFVCEQFIEPGTAWRVGFEYRGHVVGYQPIVVKFCRLVQHGLYLSGGQFTVEPAMMTLLEVDEQELQEDIRDRRNPLDTAEFVPPEKVAG